MTTAATATALGANSEVGTLRTVMVHRPDIAHERLLNRPERHPTQQ